MRLRNLRVLSKLEVGDKLCTRQHPFTIMKESTHIVAIPFSAVYRWINCESRSQTIDAIGNLVASVLEHGGSASEDNRSKIGDELFACSKGIQCLIETYRDDRTAVSSLEIIVDSIKNFIGDYKPKASVSEDQIKSQNENDA